MPCLFEFAGGEAALHRLEDVFYGKVLADPLRQPLFGAGQPRHVEHVEFGTRVAVQHSHAADAGQLHPLREVPRWRWSHDDG